MKIQVVRVDGRIETLDLVGQIQASEPAQNGLGSLRVEAAGVDHFFHAKDGAYDGWGMEVHKLPFLTNADVTNLIEEIDKAREIREQGHAK